MTKAKVGVSMGHRDESVQDPVGEKELVRRMGLKVTLMGMGFTSSNTMIDVTDTMKAPQTMCKRWYIFCCTIKEGYIVWDTAI